MKNKRRYLGYIALVLAVVGLALFSYDAFIERDGSVDYSSFLIGSAGLVTALGILRKPKLTGFAR